LKPILILCLGNEILSDDGFGAVVAKHLQSLNTVSDEVEIIFAPIAGFELLNLLSGRRIVLIVDTIVSGKDAPGTLKFNSSGTFTPSKYLTTSHQINLPTALELGRKLNLDMPAEVEVLTVEAQDVSTLKEELTPPVRDAVEKAVKMIRDWLMADGC
jgi:hydrogenase maturation protease